MQTHDHKPDQWRTIVSRLTNSTPIFQDHFLSLAEAPCYPGDRPCGVSVAEDVLVLTKPKNKGDFLLAQIGHPHGTDELPVAHQRCDLHVGDCLTKPIEKVRTRLRVRVPGIWKKRPHQWYADTVPDHGDHENVDRGLAELPVGSVHCKDPRLSSQPQQADDHRRGQGSIQRDMLEEAVEPAAHRTD